MRMTGPPTATRLPASSDAASTRTRTHHEAIGAADGDPGTVDRIVHAVRARTDVDFAMYRRATVERRIFNRMIAAGIACRREYLDRLERDPDEVSRLLERLTIKVSRFYRNAVTFDFLDTQVLPALARRANGRALRVWSAGCGFGQEPYTVAMLLAAHGIAGTVHATDVDPFALTVASTAVFSSACIAELPTSLAQRFLVPETREGRKAHRVCDEVRARVRFAPGDITRAVPCDGPVGAPAHPPVDTAYDLILCRNVLIYLNRDAQARALGHLLRALAPHGTLCLGEAEWPPPDLAGQLVPQGTNTQVFTKASDARAGIA